MANSSNDWYLDKMLVEILDSTRFKPVITLSRRRLRVIRELCSHFMAKPLCSLCRHIKHYKGAPNPMTQHKHVIEGLFLLTCCW